MCYCDGFKQRSRLQTIEYVGKTAIEIQKAVYRVWIYDRLVIQSVTKSRLMINLIINLDPSRNHRAYRISVGKLQPPVVPFMPLLLKDMTFTHEGNKTSLDGLVNFEKMHMLAQTMRTIRFCRSRHLGSIRPWNLENALQFWFVTVLEPPSPKSEGEVKSYISCLRVIDNQRILTSMSQKLEPRRS